MRFQSLTQAAILMKNQVVVAMNEQATRIYPDLMPGDSLSGRLKEFYEENAPSGSLALTTGLGVYVARADCGEEGDALLLTLNVKRPADSLRLRSDFLLRNELQRIYINLQKLIGDGDWLKESPRQKDYIAGMLRSVQVVAHRLNSNELLEELGDNSIHMRTINIGEQFRQVCDKMKQAEVFTKVRVDYRAPAPDIYAKAEPVTLQKAFYYLIERAVAHTMTLPEEERNVRIRLEKLDGRVHFEIENSGEILPADYFQHHLLGTNAYTFGDYDDCISISAANRIFEHFGGFLMFSSKEEGTKINAVMPAVQVLPTDVRRPAYEVDPYGGFSPVKRHLAELLPDTAFDPLKK